MARYVCEMENQQFIYFAKLLSSFHNPYLLIETDGISYQEEITVEHMVTKCHKHTHTLHNTCMTVQNFSATFFFLSPHRGQGGWCCVSTVCLWRTWWENMFSLRRVYSASCQWHCQCCLMFSVPVHTGSAPGLKSWVESLAQHVAALTSLL